MIKFLSGPTLGAGAILIVGAVAAWMVWDAGRDHEKNKTEDQNNEATERADDAAVSLDSCIAAGGVFDFATGKCSGN